MKLTIEHTNQYHNISDVQSLFMLVTFNCEVANEFILNTTTSSEWRRLVNINNNK